VPASFETWLAAAFDHPVGEPEWYWGEQFDDEWEALSLTDHVTVAYLQILFRDPGVLAVYSLDQVAQGIWFLIGDSSPAQPSYALVRSEVALADRLACVRSITEFFRRFVAPSAPGPADQNGNSFHTACYMWWDIFPTRGGPHGPEAELQEACLQVMRDCLTIQSELCQLSALHGLNHWHAAFPQQVEEAVDGFLAREQALSPSIRTYAAAARQGCCQ